MISAWRSALSAGAATGVSAGTGHYLFGPKGIFFGVAVGITWLPQIEIMLAKVASRFLNWDYIERSAVAEKTARFCERLANCLLDPEFWSVGFAGSTGSTVADYLIDYDTSPSDNHFRVITQAIQNHLRYRAAPALLTTAIVFTGTTLGSFAGPLGSVAGSGASMFLAYKVALRGDPVTLVIKAIEQLSEEERQQLGLGLKLIANEVRRRNEIQEPLPCLPQQNSQRPGQNDSAETNSC